MQRHSEKNLLMITLVIFLDQWNKTLKTQYFTQVLDWKLQCDIQSSILTFVPVLFHYDSSVEIVIEVISEYISVFFSTCASTDAICPPIHPNINVLPLIRARQQSKWFSDVPLPCLLLQLLRRDPSTFLGQPTAGCSLELPPGDRAHLSLWRSPQPPCRGKLITADCVTDFVLLTVTQSSWPLMSFATQIY